MDGKYWEEIISELAAAVQSPEHPFRYVTLATVGLDRIARLRTIVLREVISPAQEFVFFSDSRSKKIMHIKEYNKVSLLFYNPEKLLQLRVEGVAQILKNDEDLKPYKKRIPSEARKNYTTSLTPGSSVDEPSHIDYLSDDDFFCAVKIQPFKMEYLKLLKPNHVRIRYSRQGDQWKAEYLVP